MGVLLVLDKLFSRLSPLVLACFAVAGCGAETTEGDEASADALTLGNRPWDDQAETEWSNWIAGIGEARAAGRCTTVNACLDDPSINPLKAPGDARLDVFADCADLPMELRGYFAVKTNRPFQFVNAVTGNGDRDIRYDSGIRPTSFRDAREFRSMQSMLKAISNEVHSGFFRMAGDVEGSDTYPVDVNRESVRPGTVFYDPNGHVLLVYKVEPSGVIRLIDGHPDNSLTYGVFGERLVPGGRAQGGGFRNFRPYSVQDGRIVRATNDRLAARGHLSATAQYGHGGNYHGWVRDRLTNGAARVPDDELVELTTQLCIDITDRVDSVAAGSRLASGHLGPIPPNIYGADGEWESFSTPSRDARLKASFRGIHRHIRETVAAVQAGDPRIQWRGSAADLVRTYADVWHGIASACRFSYRNSQGATVNLTMHDVQERLFDLSFDPYHCVEMRWGAYPRFASEARTCSPFTQAHVTRFEEERKNRNAIDRLYGEPTPRSFGPETPEDVNVPRLLETLARQR